MLSAQNNSGSTALHWAALNSQLEVAQKLVQYPGGAKLDLIDIKNKAGLSPLGEAENAGWEEGAKWFVEVMNLEPAGSEQIDDEATLDAEECTYWSVPILPSHLITNNPQMEHGHLHQSTPRMMPTSTIPLPPPQSNHLYSPSSST